MSYEAVAVEHDSSIEEIEDALYPSEFRKPDNIGDRSYLLHDSENGGVFITEDVVGIEYEHVHEADETWERDAERYLNDIAEYGDSRISITDLLTDHEPDVTMDDLEFDMTDVHLMEPPEYSHGFGFTPGPK